MKGIIIKKYGDAEVLTYTSDLEAPQVGKYQVLVENYAAGLNPHDIYLRNGALASLLSDPLPIVPGLDIAGKVAAVGTGVRTLKVGDDVYGMMDAQEELAPTGFAKTGAYAEFCVTREDTLSRMPQNISFVEAASIPLVGLTAYQALVKKVQVKSGQKILINGASGGVGSMALQLANHWGLHTTAVCSQRTSDFVSTLHPHKIIDYQVTDFTQEGVQYDIIFDVVGNQSFEACQASLTANGVYISNVPTPNTFLAYQNPSLETKYGFHKRNKYNWVIPNGEDLAAITLLIEQDIVKPVVNKVFQIAEADKAHRYAEAHEAQGKIVLKIHKNG